MADYLIHFNPYHDPKTGRFDYTPGDTTLPKGMKLNSVSGKYLDSKAYRKSGRWMYTYRPDEEWDAKVYRGPFSAYLTFIGYRIVREHEYETVNNLRMPSRKEREDEFKSILNDKKFSEIAKKELYEVNERLKYQGVGNDEEKKRFSEFDANNIKTDKDFKTAYMVFSHMMESAHSFKTSKEYAKRVSKKWDAMVDDNNKGVYNDTIDPIIVFKADKFLKDVSDPKSKKYISMDEINKNIEAVRDILKQKGEEVKL